MRSRLLLTVLAATCCVACGVRSLADDLGPNREPNAEQIRRWIADLDNERFLVRERATTRLSRVGQDAIELLAETADSSRLEAATRAVRILLGYCEQDDKELAHAALERLAALTNRPTERAAARMILAVFRAERAQKEILRLGGERSVLRSLNVPGVRQATGDLRRLKLGQKWKGGDAGLKHVNDLRSLLTLSVYNKDVTDAGIGHLNGLPSVTRIEFYGTKVSAEGVAELRKRLPHVVIEVRGGAQLGIGCSRTAQRAEIDWIEPNSAADVAGLLKDDVIVAFSENPVTDFKSLTAMIAACEPGQKVKLQLLRGSQIVEKEAVLGQWR